MNFNKTQKKIGAIGLILIILWIFYSFMFRVFYEEAVIFSTVGAQPLVKILEIIEYRGNELLPYLASFFTLTSLTFLYCLYFFKSDKNNRRSVLLIGIIFTGIILFNLINQLALLLIMLVFLALLIMYSLTITVNYLYVEDIKYESGDILHTEGPFETKIEAEDYSLVMLEKQQSYFDKLLLKSDIYQNEKEKYYVDIYLEK